MLLIPIKCKLCGKLLSPPDAAKIIGESPQVQNQKIIARIMSHIGSKAQEEQKTGGPHAQALFEATMASQNLHAAALIGCFEITPEMEKDRQSVFARIHALTRTVKVSTADLMAMVQCTCPIPCCTGLHVADGVEERALRMLMDLRDRYESLGKYAPANAPQTTEEMKP